MLNESKTTSEKCLKWLSGSIEQIKKGHPVNNSEEMFEATRYHLTQLINEVESLKIDTEAYREMAERNEQR